MTRAQYLPTLLIIINCASAAMYAMGGDVRHAIYWAASAVLTASITF